MLLGPCLQPVLPFDGPAQATVDAETIFVRDDRRGLLQYCTVRVHGHGVHDLQTGRGRRLHRCNIGREVGRTRVCGE